MRKENLQTRNRKQRSKNTTDYYEQFKASEIKKKTRPLTSTDLNMR
jgi:hypothetical protein